MDLYRFHTEPEKLDLYVQAGEFVPSLIWERYSNRTYLYPELKKREKILARHPKYAYRYALDVLKGPFPAGEAAIATDTTWAFKYAMHVLKERFPLGEEVIAQNDWFAYIYAEQILLLSYEASQVWGKLVREKKSYSV